MNKKGDLVTQKQVEEFVETFANTILLPHIDGMIQHYMKQIPGLVATMLADALKANGMEMKGPKLGVVCDICGAPEQEASPCGKCAALIRDGHNAAMDE